MQKHRILPASMKPSLFVFKGITGPGLLFYYLKKAANGTI